MEEVFWIAIVAIAAMAIIAAVSIIVMAKAK